MSECGSDVYNSLINLKLNATNKLNNFFVSSNFGAEEGTPLTNVCTHFLYKTRF